MDTTINWMWFFCLTIFGLLLTQRANHEKSMRDHYERMWKQAIGYQDAARKTPAATERQEETQ